MLHTEKNLCRICLGTKNLMEIFAGKTPSVLAERIMYCASVQVTPEDELPSKICSECLVYLNVTYVFKTVCQWTDSQLRQQKLTHTSHNEGIKENLAVIKDKNMITLTNDNPAIKETCKELHFCPTRFINENLCLKKDSEIQKLFVAYNQKVGTDTPFMSPTNNEQDLGTDYNATNESDSSRSSSSLDNSLKFSEKEVDCFTESKDNISLQCDQSNSHLEEQGRTSGFNRNDLLNLNCDEKHRNFVDNVALNNEKCVNELEIDFKHGIEIRQWDEDHLIVENTFIDKIANHVSKNFDCEFINKNSINKKTDSAIEKSGSCDNGIKEVLIDKLNDKGFTLQKETSNFYNDQSVLLNNNKDPLLHEEKCNCRDDIIAETDGLEKENPSLTSISLQDFEAFEKEQLIEENSMITNNFKSSNNRGTSKQKKAENRVGRHIAKKNACQPPKRYGPPAPQTAPHFRNDDTKQNMDNDLALAEKDTEIVHETDEKLENNLKDINGIFNPEYILESDLSLPEPIFEETVVTDNSYFISDASFSDDLKVDAVKNQEIERNSNVQLEIKRRRRKTAFKKGNTKINKNKKRAKMPAKFKPENETQPSSSINSVEICSKPTRLQRKKASQNNKSKKLCYISNNSPKTDSEHNAEYNTDNQNLDDDYSDEVSSDDDYTQQKRSKLKESSRNTCKICNKSFPFPSHLQRHLTAHIGVKRYTCKYCSKPFLHSYNLSVHVRSHTGNFPLKCNICGRGFASPSVLERHKRSHTGERPYRCQYCLQLFSHASSLTMHEKMHVNRPAFSCDVCFKIFSYKSSLTAHRKIHSGLKPHSCSVCHKRFSRRTSLIRHMSCHSEQKSKC